jgi:hypothetical protein
MKNFGDRVTREQFFISCWSTGADESNHMWNLCCDSGEGVVIQTTFAKLEAVCLQNEKGHPGCVQYGQGLSRTRNYFDFALWKTRKYKDEKEVRIVVQGSRDDQFIMLTIEPTKLIESIRLHPHATQTFYDRVQSLLGSHQTSLTRVLGWSSLRKNV